MKRVAASARLPTPRLLRLQIAKTIEPSIAWGVSEYLSYEESLKFCSKSFLFILEMIIFEIQTTKKVRYEGIEENVDIFHLVYERF